ncbi:uncharacterized protein LOC120625979 [Pararge aegeria]|uniref:uncharacterized protein LOC120625979 n=1 Tax=Pararge aegeria TaxID=116150 RepID=UPI0019D0459A|nr:uncharacterized protein LOC120625979 [Pararge aegeria]
MTNLDRKNINITVNNTTIEQVRKYVYLGQKIRMRKDNQNNEIHRRVRLICIKTSSVWTWAGHIAWKENAWCKRLLEWKTWGEKCPHGRPQMRWKDDVKKVAGSNWIHTAQCREKWKILKEA